MDLYGTTICVRDDLYNTIVHVYVVYVTEIVCMSTCMRRELFNLSCIANVDNLETTIQ